MSKITLGPLIRHILTLLIGFFVAKQMLSVDVQQKLLRGDTVELWGGAWSFNLKQVTDFLINCWPVIVPILIAIRGRLIEKYKLIVARLSAEQMTDTEIKAVAKQTSLPEIISTIQAKP